MIDSVAVDIAVPVMVGIVVDTVAVDIGSGRPCEEASQSDLRKQLPYCGDLEEEAMELYKEKN
jgi:hypothetical protein